jgi:hypothetical protein
MPQVKISKKQLEFLQSDNEYVILSTGIGFGKTFIAAEKACQLLLNGAYVVVVAQSYKALKTVLFAEIKARLQFHGVPYLVNHTDMILEIDLPGIDGKVFGYSGDVASIENCRGITADVAIFDECALLPQYSFDVVFGRLRRGKVPLQVFAISSPRGKNNYFYELATNPEHHVITASTMDNPFLPVKYVRALKKQFKDEWFLQEVMGQFVDLSVANALFNMAMIKASQDRPLVQSDDIKIAGLDVARYGDDTSALVIRNGNVVEHIEEWGKISLDVLQDYVASRCGQFAVDMIVIDSIGLGAGVADNLRRLMPSTKVIDFNGGYKADNIKYFNLRTECFVLSKDWIESTGVLPKHQQFIKELLDINYDYKESTNQMYIESKDVMKLRKVQSPNIADAFSMTFGRHARKLYDGPKWTRKPKTPVRFAG